MLFFDRKPASEKPWTQNLWIYDLRTNMHFTLKTNPLKRADLDEFVACYNAENRHERKETERFKSFAYDDLLKRDKVSLDIFWLKDESLEDSANLPDPDVIAAEIAEDLQAALEQFTQIAADLRNSNLRKALEHGNSLGRVSARRNPSENLCQIEPKCRRTLRRRFIASHPAPPVVSTQP